MSLLPEYPHCTYLVVDDDAGDVLMIVDTLESLTGGRTVHTVGDGQQALDFLRRTGSFDRAPRPDVILLDLNMPRMGGRETLVAIKGDAALRSIPVVVFSTSTAVADIDDCLDAHANAYVAKPVEFAALETALSTIDGFYSGLARRRSTDSVPVDEHTVA